MRLALAPVLTCALGLALVAAAGCLQAGNPGPDPGGGGWTGSSGTPISGCIADTDCGSQICARDGACYPATSIRAVHVTWSVRGQIADATSCAHTVNLHIRFSSPQGESFGYAPVPCKNGKYTMDKLPTLYTEVELGPEGSTVGATAVIDRSTGYAVIDLP